MRSQIQPNNSRPQTNKSNQQRQNILQPLNRSKNNINSSTNRSQDTNIKNEQNYSNFGNSIYKFGPYKQRYRAYSTQTQKFVPRDQSEVNTSNILQNLKGNFGISGSLNTSFQEKQEERSSRILKIYNNKNNNLNSSFNSSFNRSPVKKFNQTFVAGNQNRDEELGSTCDKNIHNPEAYQDIKKIENMTHKLNELEADFLKRHSQFLQHLEKNYEIVKTLNENYLKRRQQSQLARKSNLLLQKFEQKLHQYNFIELFNSENSLIQLSKSQNLKIRELQDKLHGLQQLKGRVQRKEESGNVLYTKILGANNNNSSSYQSQDKFITFNQDNNLNNNSGKKVNQGRKGSSSEGKHLKSNQSKANFNEGNVGQSFNQTQANYSYKNPNQNLQKGPLITNNKVEVLQKQNSDLKKEIKRLNDIISRLQIKSTDQFQMIIEKPKQIDLNSQEEISKLFKVLNPNNQDFLPQKKVEFLKQVLKKQQEVLNLEEIKNQHNQIFESIQALNIYNQGKINKVNIQNIVLMGIYQYLQDNNVESYFSNENLGEKITFEQQMILTGQVQQCQYFQLQLKEQSDIALDFIISIGDSQKYAQFTQNIAELISLILEIRPNDLQIIQLSDTKRTISFIVDFHVELDEEMVQKFKLADVEITEHNLLQNCQLTFDFFQPNFYEICQQLVEKKYVGKLIYKSLPEPVPQAFFPALGFSAVSVNVKNKFELVKLTNQQGSTKEMENDWYSEDISDKSWIMLFNVIKNQQDYESEVVKQVMDKHISANCKITEQYILYTGNCYLYQNIQQKLKLVHEFELDGKIYQMGFQCRIQPRGVKVPEESDDLYIVGYPKDIRPYKIIVRQKIEEQ